ncbi:MAG TPA: hypothetical protein VE757_09025 [Gaiellaceae bacterium]|nr:hypothetical protein [Gaiellaceae bacterium]
MSKGDLLVERGARRLQQLADRAAARGDGVGEWLSDELRNDAVFLRKLKPSLIAARAKGESPRSHGPAETPPPADTPPGPAATPQPAARPKPKQKSKKRSGRGGPPAIAIVGAAFVAGIVLSKFVDWRGHAHPRD